jgi:RNA polymerase sigma-70 factor (ECF subfamily)
MWKPFQTTIWTSILQARDGKSTAVNDFVGKYRQPVLSFIRRQGYSEEDAEDLCQEVFLILLKDNLLARAEQTRGRFRSFLLGVARNVVRNAGRVRTAAKRGGAAAPASLDARAGDDAALSELVEAGPPEESFDRDWIHHMIQLALEALERRHPRLHQVMKMHLDQKLPYAEMARALGLEAKQVDNLLQQSRAKLGDLIRGEIAAYCGSREEYDDEIACLKRYLAPARTPAEPL